MCKVISDLALESNYNFNCNFNVEVDVEVEVGLKDKTCNLILKIRQILRSTALFYFFIRDNPVKS